MDTATWIALLALLVSAGGLCLSWRANSTVKEANRLAKIDRDEHLRRSARVLMRDLDESIQMCNEDPEIKESPEDSHPRKVQLLSSDLFELSGQFQDENEKKATEDAAHLSIDAANKFGKWFLQMKALDSRRLEHGSVQWERHSKLEREAFSKAGTAEKEALAALAKARDTLADARSGDHSTT